MIQTTFALPERIVEMHPLMLAASPSVNRMITSSELPASSAYPLRPAAFYSSACLPFPLFSGFLRLSLSSLASPSPSSPSRPFSSLSSSYLRRTVTNSVTGRSPRQVIRPSPTNYPAFVKTTAPFLLAVLGRIRTASFAIWWVKRDAGRKLVQTLDAGICLDPDFCLQKTLPLAW